MVRRTHRQQTVHRVPGWGVLFQALLNAFSQCHFRFLQPSGVKPSTATFHPESFIGYQRTSALPVFLERPRGFEPRRPREFRSVPLGNFGPHFVLPPMVCAAHRRRKYFTSASDLSSSSKGEFPLYPQELFRWPRLSLFRYSSAEALSNSRENAICRIDFQANESEQLCTARQVRIDVG